MADRCLRGATPLKWRAITDQRMSAAPSSRCKLIAVRRGRLRLITCRFELKCSKAGQQSGNACAVPPVCAARGGHVTSVQLIPALVLEVIARVYELAERRTQPWYIDRAALDLVAHPKA
jgi:hypothetical protein